MPSKRTQTYPTSSSEETKRLGEEFAAEVLHPRRPSGATNAFVISLTGDLGAGKTTFIQGFLRGAGVRRRAPSPTFVIMRHYKMPRPKRGGAAFGDIHHMDAYRLKGGTEAKGQLAVLGFEALLRDPKNILLIEWGERIAGELPRGAVKIAFGYGKKEGERKISITRP